MGVVAMNFLAKDLKDDEEWDYWEEEE